MPEQCEPTAEALKLKHAILQAQSEGSDFSSVISLWCDATNSEAAKSSKDSCFHCNLVDQIDTSCIFERGQTKAQDQLFPPQIVNKKEKPEDLVISDLFLKGPDSISATACALILDLGPLKLLFAFLTHCNLNLYSREQWEKSICVLTKAQCHFSIGLAFEFRLHLSLLISYSSIDPPPFEATIPNLCFQFTEFLDMEASELSEILDSNHSKGTKLAIKAVQDLKHFHGAGAYTSIELFGMAGTLIINIIFLEKLSIVLWRRDFTVSDCIRGLHISFTYCMSS
ncbi:hypothetical protein BT96DRAFT_1006033 [Gymnopus androsaceus JB14]|uniref:Uncharacterized protein n=1 Tax=Gymnopus androsaceus JB14 TaxID=1447944 RepID=A0A6A4GMS5_9AGAR|nr:hypothetical protein BT96DRAFT_1006033 [Gymnopus androsaceus JB14]